MLKGVFVVLAVCTLTAGRSDLWTEDRGAQVLLTESFQSRFIKAIIRVFKCFFFALVVL